MALIDAFQSLAEFGLVNAIVVVLTFLIFAILLMEALKKLPSVFGFETKAAIKERELNEKITNMENDIKALQGSAKKFNEDRVNDRAQSFNYQHEYMDIVNSLNTKQDQMLEQIKDLAEQNRKYQLADMRETLLQAHRYYTSESTNPLKIWTELEKHAWDEQYDVYINNRGNGYMQNTIKPEMDKLRVVSLNDYETMAELMASRTKSKN